VKALLSGPQASLLTELVPVWVDVMVHSIPFAMSGDAVAVFVRYSVSLLSKVTPILKGLLDSDAAIGPARALFVSAQVDANRIYPKTYPAARATKLRIWMATMLI
jgi:hypothetical protein